MAPEVDTRPVWELTAPAAPDWTSLEGSDRAEVIVIGGGFCGLSAALHLAMEGRKVILLEARQPGWGASGRNGGQVIPGLKASSAQLQALYGIEMAEPLLWATRQAPEQVFSLIERLGIDCDAHRSGWIQLAAGANGMREIESRAAPLIEAGAEIEILGKDRAMELTGSADCVGGMLDHSGGTINPLAFARGMAQQFDALGGKLYCSSAAESVKQIKGKWVVETMNGQATASRLLICTNAYSDASYPGIATSIVPFTSGVIATEPLSPELRARVLPGRQGAADNRRLLTWFSVDPEGRLVYGSRSATWNGKASEKDLRQRIDRMHQAFPALRDVRVSHYWSGEVALTADGVPHLHRLADKCYAGLGFNGRGVAMATQMGKWLADCLLEEDAVPGFPVTPLRPIPLHRWRGPAVRSVALWKRLLDSLSP